MRAPAPGPSPRWQEVLDTAAVLQLHRKGVVEAMAAGAEPAGVRIVGHGPLLAEQVMREALTWSHLLSVRRHATATQTRQSLPNNKAALAKGMRMVSVFDWEGTTSGAKALLGQAAEDGYLFGHAAMEMKIINGCEVLLQGPYLDGNPSVIGVSTTRVLEAALRHWRAVMATAVPVKAGLSHGTATLTVRQKHILELMSHDVPDQSIADILGVSLRTVRYDIASVLDLLGVRSRFSAGLRLAAMSPSQAEAPSREPAITGH